MKRHGWHFILLWSFVIAYNLGMLKQAQAGLFRSSISNNPIFENGIPLSRVETGFSGSFQGKPSPRQMFYRRYANPGAPPVVLAHGILNTSWMMEYLARDLFQQGYDVWSINHLGFGLDGERSYVIQPEVGDYGIGPSVRGLEQILTHIHQTTQQKLNYVGFSMGGMLYHLLISGAVGIDEQGYPHFDEQLGLQISKMFSRAVIIGAPNYNLEGLALMPRLLFSSGNILFQKQFKKKDEIFNLGFGSMAGASDKKSGIGKWLDFLQFPGGDFAVKYLVQDAGNLNHFGPLQKNQKWMLAAMFSNPHTDILRSFFLMMTKGLIEPEKNYQKIPTLLVMGSKDRLADPWVVYRNFRDAYVKNENISAILMSDFGHLDMLLPESLHEVGFSEYLVQFLEDSDNYKKHHDPLQLLGYKHFRADNILETFLTEVPRQKIPFSCDQIFL